MSFRVEQKVGNNIYVYEAKSYWDKEKKQSRQKRKFIGKKDKITGKLIATENKGKSRPVKSVDFGNTFFLKKITEKSGLADIVNEIVPCDSKALLTHLHQKSSQICLLEGFRDNNLLICKGI